MLIAGVVGDDMLAVLELTTRDIDVGVGVLEVTVTTELPVVIGAETLEAVDEGAEVVDELIGPCEATTVSGNDW